MKKRTGLILLIVLSILSSSFISGCAISRFIPDDDSLADKRMEQVFDAIKNQDKNALKSVFSNNAINDAGDIDSDIDDFMAFIEGDVKSWDRDDSAVVFDRVDEGYWKKQLMIEYYLYTDKEKYIVFLSDFPIDEINPDNEGLYALKIIKAADAGKYIDDWASTPGIDTPNKKNF